MANYYVDFEAAVTGDGSSGTPFSWDQFITCASNTSFDTFYCRGKRALSADFNLGFTPSVLIFDAWSIPLYGPWRLYGGSNYSWVDATAAIQVKNAIIDVKAAGFSTQGTYNSYIRTRTSSSYLESPINGCTVVYEDSIQQATNGASMSGCVFYAVNNDVITYSSGGSNCNLIDSVSNLVNISAMFDNPGSVTVTNSIFNVSMASVPVWSATDLTEFNLAGNNYGVGLTWAFSAYSGPPYYVWLDESYTTSGHEGSPSDPWSFEQLRDSISAFAGTTATFYLRGARTNVNDVIKTDPAIYDITFDAWDLNLYGPWRMSFEGSWNNEIYKNGIVRFTSASYGAFNTVENVYLIDEGSSSSTIASVSNIYNSVVLSLKAYGSSVHSATNSILQSRYGGSNAYVGNVSSCLITTSSSSAFYFDSSGTSAFPDCEFGYILPSNLPNMNSPLGAFDLDVSGLKGPSWARDYETDSWGASRYSVGSFFFDKIVLADFSATPTLGASPLFVTFTNLSSGASAYLWDFGDGYTSTASDPTHTYDNSGTYTVSLSAFGEDSSAVETKVDYINVFTIIADFSATPRVGPSPLSVQFTNLSINASTYVWDFGDGSPASFDVNPLHEYSADGCYNVTLSAYSGDDMDFEVKNRYINVGLGHIGAFYFGPVEETVSADVIEVSAILLQPDVTVVDAVSATVTPFYIPVYVTLLQPTVYATQDIKVNFVGVPRAGSSPLVVDFTASVELGEGLKNRYVVDEYLWCFDYDEVNGTCRIPWETSKTNKISHVYTGYRGQKYTVKVCVKLKLL